jgi:hypothetical protein
MWLQRLQIPFAILALGALGYELYLIRRRPFHGRKWSVRLVAGASVAINVLVFGYWAMLWLRYR